MVSGLTSASLGSPDHALAMRQHDAYIQALERCGLSVTIMEADESFPDSTFIEDTCLVTPNCAVMTRPGAPSRLEETREVEKVIQNFCDTIEHITAPGTIDAGDIMMTGSHFYIGLSERTDKAGARQMTSVLERHGMTASTIALEHVLHLKTGISYLENNILLAAGEFINHPALEHFDIIEVPETESYAANSLWVNDKVLVPKGFNAVMQMIEKKGYETLAVDVSEFQKLDGGLSCLSLRF